MSATPQPPRRPRTTLFLDDIVGILVAFEIPTVSSVITEHTSRGTCIRQVSGPTESRISWGTVERPDSEVLDAKFEIRDHVGVFIARITCTGDDPPKYRRSRRGFAQDDHTEEMSVMKAWIEEALRALYGPRLEPYAPAP